MLVADDPATLRAWRRDAPRPLGLVPTMGALHAGHMSLVDGARVANASVVASVFVNPLQFGPDEDLDSYPRDLPGDLTRLRDAGVDAVFAPAAERFTAALATRVSVGGVTNDYEGAFRPGHFDGVATIVTKLFNVVGADRAYFGEKDYQQLVMIRRMAHDLDVPVDVVGMPIVRDHDGLALSSRNVHLSADERRRALRLSRALRAAAGWQGDADTARAALREVLGDGAGVDVDYADVVDEDTLQPLIGRGHASARALIAARVGRTRLIDNARLVGSAVGGGSARPAPRTRGQEHG